MLYFYEYIVKLKYKLQYIKKSKELMILESKKYEENIINSPWAVGLGTTLFGFLLSLANDYFKKTPFLTTVNNLFKKITHFIIFILNFKVKFWIILAIILLLILIVFIISKNSNEAKPEYPSFYNYKEDQLKGFKWSWSWSKSTRGWCIKNLKPHCPKCDTPMRIDYYFSSGECPRCDYYASRLSSNEKIERIIIDNINRNIIK